MTETPDRPEFEDLASLPREAPPDPAVEERVVGALRERGLLGSPEQPFPWWRRPTIAAAAAVAVLGIAIGWFARGWLAPLPQPVEQRADAREFLVLLSEPEGLRTSKPEGELVAEYRAWAFDLAERGLLVSGKRLEAGGTHLSSPRQGEVLAEPSDQPWAPTGFFLLRAEGWDDAVRLARSSPHLGYGGSVSVRAIADDRGAEVDG